MDKSLITIGALLVAAGISALPKEKAAAVLAGGGLIPLAAGVIMNVQREQRRANQA